MATLRIFRGDQFVAPFELGEGRTRIGRGTENQLVLEDRDKQVSRTHAEIRHERGQYLITDLNSQNGVWIGERQIKAEEVVPVNVPVTIGPYRLLLMPEESAQPAARAAGVAAKAPEPEPYAETQLGELPVTPTPPRPDQAAPPPPAPAQKPSAAARSHATKIPAAKVPEPKVRAGASGKLIGIAALIAVIVIGAIVVAVVMKPGSDVVQPPPGGQEAAGPPPSSTTTTMPPTPTPEEQFLEHLNRAAALIAANDKAGALAANTEAMAALPNDSRALEQQKQIAAMPEPGGPVVTAPLPNPPGPGPSKPTVPEFLRVSARPGEAEKERLGREKSARTQLEEGRRALVEQRWDSAITSFLLALKTSERSDYGLTADETNRLLRQARQAKATAEAEQRHANAQRALEEAKTIGGGNVLAAAQKVREARNLDPAIEGADELMSSLVVQGRTQGERAVVLARNHEIASRRDDAIREYERAVSLLELGSAEHKDLVFARQRLVVLLKTPK